MKTKGIAMFHLEWNNHLKPIYGENGTIIACESDYQTQSWDIILENGERITGSKETRRKLK